MSDNFAHLDVDDDEFESAPKALRDAYKKLQKAHNEQGQQITELSSQLSSQALSGVLTGFKNPDRVKSALLGDKVDPLDTEAVAKWIETNGDDYAKAENSGTPATQQEEQTEEAQAYAGLQLGGHYRPAADLGKLDAVAANLPTDATPEQVAAAIRAAGI